VILSLWKTLHQYPLGRFIFNMGLRFKVPYTATIRPWVVEMSEGFVRVQMKDRRRVRNHLQSIHAIALMNLGEASTGLAVLSALPENTRAIITHLEIDFLKKARGKLEASARYAEKVQGLTENRTTEVEAQIRNENNEVVARVKARWMIGPKVKKINAN